MILFMINGLKMEGVIMDRIEIFIHRMKKIGIDIKLVSNFPWIYIDTINGKRVTETFHGNHGFTIAFLPIKKDQEVVFTDITEIFRLIRKYLYINNDKTHIQNIQ